MADSSTENFFKSGLSAVRSILLYLLFLYSVGFLTASLLYDAVRSLAEGSLFDPFAEDGSTYTWVNISIWVVALCVSTLFYFLYRRFLTRIDKSTFRNTYRVLSILLLFALGFVANVAAEFSVDKLNVSEKRLEKVVKLYGPREDLCQVLKLGMTIDEMVAAIGYPPGKQTIGTCLDEKGCSETYCPQSGECRDVIYDKSQKLIKIECWTGKAIGIPI